MKKALLIFLLVAVAASAQFRDATGTTAHPLLKIGFGPRAAAMGNAYVGFAPDITALWWNPAGLNQLNTYEALISHHEWLRGIRDEFAALIWPQSANNTFGFAMNFTSAAGIERWDADNNPGTGADSLVMAYEAMLVGSYTRLLGERFGVGASFKGIYENLAGPAGYGGAVDLSLHWKASPVFALGLALQNLGPGMFYPGGMYMFPMQAQLGAALTFEDVLYGLNLLTDVRVPFDNNVSVHAGAEVWPLEILAARVGFQSGPQTLGELNYLAGLTGGVGLVLNNYRVDYAIAPYAHLGLTHRLALIAAFGERPRYGGVIVRVIDAETKKSLAAHLKVEGVTRAESDLVENETWERKGLAPGRVSATASKEDYYPSSGQAQIKAGQTAQLVIALSKIPPGGITGRVFDVKTNDPLVATITYEGPEGIKGEVKTDEDGNYTISGLYRGDYALFAEPQHPKYFPQDAEVKVEAAKGARKDFALLREKELIVFYNVNFETGEARVLPDFYDVLDEIGQIFADNPTIVVELGGHTDSRPIKTPEFADNMKLSQARVEAVREYLIDKFQIDEERLSAKGYGDTQPIASNETEEGMAKNRRVEFKVLTGIEYFHEIRNIRPEEED
jgi:outer membrane protein OmpA-like peptidoglycan-associated protein